MPRVLIAGFQHETNTFGATKARFEDFEYADAWPGLLLDDQVIPGTAGINLPIAGFVDAAKRDETIKLLPRIWCAAEPSSYVTNDAFERISGVILSGIAEAGSLDGIYLDLHGAMVTESYEDGEGELLSRIRDRVGPELPIVVSLDLHANVTERMVHHASAMTIFRTYPHLDMADSGGRAFVLLHRLMSGEKLAKSFRQVPFLIPLTAQYTGVSPCREIYGLAEGLSQRSGGSADFACGFPAADIRDMGASVVAYAEAEQKAETLTGELLQLVMDNEHAFESGLMSPEDAVRIAMSVAEDRPVVIADVQDNPGAGATSDTTGLLTALIDGNAQGAVLALLDDPEVAARAHADGIGATFTTALGGKSGLPGLCPYEGRFEVVALSDGRFAFTGDMYAGSVAEIGPTAVLRVLGTTADVRVVVGSKRCQCLDLAIFSHIGIEPADQQILAVKSSVHFRADFEPIAARVLNAEAPGANPCRLDLVHYRHLRPGVRLGPGGELSS